MLIVDDDPDALAAMAALLRFWGHRPLSALTLRAAVAIAEECVRNGTALDFVVSDINLPDGTGWELMAELSRRFGLHGVALTGYERAEDRQRSRDAGFSEHLVKPVDPERLHSAVERFAMPPP